MFMEQYWGGPQTYGEERGHPRLRMRHMEFAIDAGARDRWLTHMHDAILEMNMQDSELENQLWMYLVGAAHAMQNIDDSPGSH
jgi:hemoglobin